MVNSCLEEYCIGVAGSGIAEPRHTLSCFLELFLQPSANWELILHRFHIGLKNNIVSCGQLHWETEQFVLTACDTNWLVTHWILSRWQIIFLFVQVWGTYVPTPKQKFHHVAITLLMPGMLIKLIWVFMMYVTIAADKVILFNIFVYVWILRYFRTFCQKTLELNCLGVPFMLRIQHAYNIERENRRSVFAEMKHN